MAITEEVGHKVGDAVVADWDGKPDEEEDDSALPEHGDPEDVGDVRRPPRVLAAHQVPADWLHLVTERGGVQLEAVVADVGPGHSTVQVYKTDYHSTVQVYKTVQYSVQNRLSLTWPPPRPALPSPWRAASEETPGWSWSDQMIIMITLRKDDTAHCTGIGAWPR